MDDSIGPNGCQSRRFYVTGKAIGLVVSLWSPTKIFKAKTIANILARTELAFSKLNISSKLGRFGRTANFVNAEDVAELAKIKLITDSNLKGSSARDFMLKVINGSSIEEKIRYHIR